MIWYELTSFSKSGSPPIDPVHFHDPFRPQRGSSRRRSPLTREETFPLHLPIGDVPSEENKTFSRRPKVIQSPNNYQEPIRHELFPSGGIFPFEATNSSCRSTAWEPPPGPARTAQAQRCARSVAWIRRFGGSPDPSSYRMQQVGDRRMRRFAGLLERWKI